jgi:formamidopyrimidine-DNA glycosylase
MSQGFACKKCNGEAIKHQSPKGKDLFYCKNKFCPMFGKMMD